MKPLRRNEIMTFVLSLFLVSGITRASVATARRDVAEVRAIAKHAGSPTDTWWQKMDGALLGANTPHQIIFDINWVAGAAPNKAALETFGLIVKNLIGGQPVELRFGEEIQRAEWERNKDPEMLAKRHFADRVVSEEGKQYVYVLYVPDGPWGDTAAGASGQPFCFEGQGTFQCVAGFTVVTSPLRNHGPRWAHESLAEVAVLTHEFCHLLGMVADASHADSAPTGHCTSRTCLLHRDLRKRDVRRLRDDLKAGRQPAGLCDACQKELESARRSWSQLSASEVGVLLSRHRTQQEAREAARFWWVEGDRGKALDAARRAADVSGVVEDRLRLGLYLSDANEPGESICVYAKTFAGTNGVRDEAAAAFGLALALCRCHRYDEAEQVLRKRMGAQVRRHDGSTIELLTWTLVGQGKFAEAAAAWSGTPRRVRQTLRGAIAELTLLRWAGRHEEAASAVVTQKASFSTDPVWQVEAALVERARGNTAAAGASLSALLATLREKGDVTCREIDAGSAAAAILGRREDARALIDKLPDNSACPEAEKMWLRLRAGPLVGDGDNAPSLSKQLRVIAAPDLWRDPCAVQELRASLTELHIADVCEPCAVACSY